MRNYNEINEVCFKKFIKDFKDEDKYLSCVLNVIRCLGTISIAFTLIMFIYMFAMCCCQVKFYSIAFVVSIYGILFNIIVLILITKERIKYNCHIEEFNEEMDNLIEDLYYINLIINIILCCLSLVFYFIVWIFSLWLKCMKNRNNEGIAPSPSVQVVPIQPVFTPVYPVLSNSRNAYPNMMAPSGSFGAPYC